MIIVNYFSGALTHKSSDFPKPNNLTKYLPYYSHPKRLVSGHRILIFENAEFLKFIIATFA